MKNLTDFRKTVESGMDPRLSSPSFSRPGELACRLNSDLFFG